MTFNLSESINLLRRTPFVLRSMLEGLPHEMITQNEGPDTWSPYDVVGHLIFGEQTDWIPRTKIILYASNKKFVPFDRFAQLNNNPSIPLSMLLDEFERLRNQNIRELTKMNLSKSDLSKEGIHPEFGSVTLRQLLSAWTVHDLGHITQISRVIAKHYKEAAGPWKKYLTILN